MVLDVGDMGNNSAIKIGVGVDTDLECDLETLSAMEVISLIVSIETYTLFCGYYNLDSNSWVSDGCQVCLL